MTTIPITPDDAVMIIRQKREQAALLLAQAQRDGKAWDAVGKRWVVWNAKDERVEDPE